MAVVAGFRKKNAHASNPSNPRLAPASFSDFSRGATIPSRTREQKESTMTRRGNIARLPKAAREVLNQRIDRHEEGKVSRRG